jgi:hypothetical protein
MAEYVLLGFCYRTDNRAEVMRRAERCITLSRASGNLRVLSGALAYQGEIEEDFGDYASAMTLFQQALECTRQMGDISFIAGALRTIGYCYLTRVTSSRPGPSSKTVWLWATPIGKDQRHGSPLGYSACPTCTSSSVTTPLPVL